ncbi:MAG: hypothetical protein QGH60_10595 [Phycisphaerae bacterium]|jgi:tetratricopeptide (TPR) repeat protein|nr:hypothetical protein [Phycisphaerae bacterium]
MPIVYDPINTLACKGVPIAVAVDEHGVVRGVGVRAKTLERGFLDKTFKPSSARAPADPRFSASLAALKRISAKTATARAWRDYGDALILRKGAAGVAEAIAVYSKATKLAPKDGNALFRLGVCYRMRYESLARKDGDDEKAMELWVRARRLDPSQYIWRRRIEQYGPKGDRPYVFYDWMIQAIQDITNRGDKLPAMGPTTRSAAGLTPRPADKPVTQPTKRS